MKTLPISLATVAALSFAASAMAWSDGFEAYPAGASIAGQGGWQGWDGDPSVCGIVTTAQAASGTKSLQILKDNDTVQTFSGVNSGLWTFTLQQYVPSTSSGTTWVILMNTYPSNPDWSEQINVNLTAGTIKSDNGFASATLPLVKDAWATLRFDIDLTASSVSAYYNNTLLSTHAWHDATGINALQALDLYGDASQVGPVYYDNLSLVPEPTSFALLTLGGLALAFRRKLA